MERAHDVCPDTASGVPPKGPGNRCYLGMAGQPGELVERVEKDLFRTVTRIEPNLGTSGR